jgi:hypothetical protein
MGYPYSLMDSAPESCSGALRSRPSGMRLAIDVPREKPKRNSQASYWFATEQPESIAVQRELADRLRLAIAKLPDREACGTRGNAYE